MGGSPTGLPNKMDRARWQRPVYSLNVEISGNNRFFAFFDALDYVDEESGGCRSYTLLAFSKFKMAPKMAAK